MLLALRSWIIHGLKMLMVCDAPLLKMPSGIMNHGPCEVPQCSYSYSGQQDFHVAWLILHLKRDEEPSLPICGSAPYEE